MIKKTSKKPVKTGRYQKFDRTEPATGRSGNGLPVFAGPVPSMNLMMRVSLLYLNLFWKTSAIQNVYTGFCRGFHGLSKYVITFLKMLFYDDDIPKILCLIIFSRGT
jgi:hypothetical protein